MRSQGYMIDSSKFRHYAEFKVFDQINTDTSGSVQDERETNSIPLWFSFLEGSGLASGEDQTLDTMDRFRKIQSNNKIVTRFNPDLHNYFLNKKTCRISFDNKNHTVTGLLNLNGESIYTIMEIVLTT